MIAELATQALASQTSDESDALKTAVAGREYIIAEMTEAQKKLVVLRDELSRVEQFIRQWMAFAGNESDFYFSHSQPSSRNPDKQLVGDLAERFIKSVGRPVPRRELMEFLNKQGVFIYGKQPLMVLNTMIWRMKDRFVRVARRGYWLRDRPYLPSTVSVVAQTEESVR